MNNSASRSTHTEVPDIFRDPISKMDFGTGLQRPAVCYDYEQTLLTNKRLRARDVPGIVHGIVFYVVMWAVHLLNPQSQMHTAIAVSVAWIVTFLLDYAMNIPAKAARSALVTLFSLCWLVFFGLNWRTAPSRYLIDQTCQMFIWCIFFILPIFLSRGIHLVVDRLKGSTE